MANAPLHVGNWIIRLDACLYYLTAIAGMITAHADLLPFHSPNINKGVELTCWALIGLNKAVISKWQERQ